MNFDFLKQQVGIYCCVLKRKDLVCKNKLSRQNRLNTNCFKTIYFVFCCEYFHIYVVNIN